MKLKLAMLFYSLISDKSDYLRKKKLTNVSTY